MDAMAQPAPTETVGKIQPLIDSIKTVFVGKESL